MTEGTFVASPSHALLSGAPTARLRHAAPRTGHPTLLVVLCLAVVFVVSSLPTLAGLSATSGHDIDFHLARIAGLAQALRDGEFPGYLQTVQVYGYGYPVSVCYGDAFLYLPAILVMGGISVERAYGIFVLVVNAATVGVAYLSFRRMFCRRLLGVIGAALWALSPYRLVDVYTRAAVGEFLALTFFPVIALGFQLAFSRTHESSKAWVVMGLGLAGVIYSHVLSTFIVALALVPATVVGLVIERPKGRLIWPQIVGAISLTLLLSAAFLVPFCDYYLTVPMRVTTLEGSYKLSKAAEAAVYTGQLFFYDPRMTGLGGPGTVGVAGSMALNIGWPLLGGAVLWVACRCLPHRSRRPADTAVWWCLAAAALFAFMTTRQFPWGGVGVGFLDKLLSALATIQAPWRLLSLVDLFLVIVTLAAIGELRGRPQARGLAIAVLVYMTLTVAGSMLQTYIAEKGTTYDFSTRAETALVGNGEYLPATAEHPKYLASNRALEVVSGSADVCSVVTSTSDSLTITVTTEDGCTLALPRLWYPQYVATGSNGASFVLADGGDGFMTLQVPAGYSGEVTLQYQVPAVWRIATGFSLVTCACLAVWGTISRKRQPGRGRPGHRAG